MSSIKPYICPGEEDGAEEVSGGFIVARGNGAELLQLEEEVLDQMPGFIEVFIVLTRLFSVGFWWNDALDALLIKDFQDTIIGIEGFVSQ